MDIFILLSTSTFNLLLAGIVLMRDASKGYTRIFALMCLFLTTWVVANYLTNHSPHDIELVNLANKLAFVAGFVTVMGGLAFTYVFPIKREISHREKLGVVFLLLVPSVLSLTESVAGEATLDEGGHLAFSIGPLLWLYGAGFLIGLGLIARNLFSGLAAGDAAKKKQIKSVLWAFILCALGGLIFNVVLPVATSDWSWTKFGPLSTVFLVGIVAYTIIKHGLFDIRLAVVRGAAYFLSLATLAGLYYVLAYALSEIVFHSQTSNLVSQNPISILLALVLAFAFQPVKNFFDKLTNRIFYRDEYDTNDFFATLSRELSGTTDLQTLLQRASQEISHALKAEYAYFTIEYGARKHVEVGTAHGHRLNLREVKELSEKIPQKVQVVVADVLGETDPLRHFLNLHNIAIILPLSQETGFIGYLFLGYQKGRSYTKRDVRTLETISDELIIAIQNALSVQDVKEINETLQDRIDEATKELRTTNAQLQRLDEAKDEFISMASHQLRTPLTSVKGYISMVLEGDAGKIAPQQKQLLSEAFASSERMVHLINDFLNVSRLQTGKFMLEQRPVDLAKVVKQEVESLQTTVKMHDLKLKFKAPAYFPTLFIDEGKIRQVIMNFIDNAIYYSRENSTITVRLAVEDGSAVLEVHDTGIGVPKAEQAHLFGKFFRATNARRQRPDGTGVGLFLAKKVIVAHGGSILFHSVEGQGSTFGFRLPIKKLERAPADKPSKLHK